MINWAILHVFIRRQKNNNQNNANGTMEEDDYIFATNYKNIYILYITVVNLEKTNRMIFVRWI